MEVRWGEGDFGHHEPVSEEVGVSSKGNETDGKAALNHQPTTLIMTSLPTRLSRS